MRLDVNEEVLRSIAAIDWFRQAGTPLLDPGIRRMASWEAWPGPADAGVEQLSLDLQAIKDGLEHVAPGASAEWDACVSAAVEAIALHVPNYSAAKDTWHAPTAAVWHAAWVAVLNSTLVQRGLDVPAIVSEQMAWFTRERWPAAYTPESVANAPRAYLVF